MRHLVDLYPCHRETGYGDMLLLSKAQRGTGSPVSRNSLHRVACGVLLEPSYQPALFHQSSSREKDAHTKFKVHDINPSFFN